MGRKKSYVKKEAAKAIFQNKLFYCAHHSYHGESDNELIIEYSISTANNICFRNHIVDGKPLLPADAYLELIYVACQSYLGFEFISINKMIMTRPVIEHGESFTFLRLHLVRNEDQYQFKLVSNLSDNTGEQLHAQGVVSNVAFDSHTNKSLVLPSGMACHVFDVSYFYRPEASIHLGEFYHALQALTFYDGYAVGKAILPQTDSEFSMNPAVINAALGSAITFSSHCSNENFCSSLNCFLPYSIDGLRLYAPLVAGSYNILVKLIKSTASAVECSLHISNEANDTVFEIAHFKLQKIALKNSLKQHMKASEDNVISTEGSVVNEAVAVIGVACRLPKGNNNREFWDMLKNSQDCIQAVPANRWNEFEDWYNADPENEGTASSKYGAFIDRHNSFDPVFFNIMPSEAELMDPQQRVFLEEAWSVIENAGYAPSSLSNKKCGVYVGCAEGDYSHVLAKAGKAWEAKSFPGASSAVLAARISYLLNLKGPSMAIDTSCSSSLTAIHLAAESIRRGENELALAGGINIFSTPLKQILTSQIGMQSSDGRCHTFDQAANGTVFSEGCGVVLLKPLSQAIKDNDTIWGVIRGSGINQDGKTNGITAPSALSQEKLLDDVYRQYNINPAQISYLEAHGTGTVLGDPIEVQALKAAFEKFTDQKQYCAIGSLKSNMGHAVYAAGVAGFIKVLLCMRYKQLVPSINYNNTNKRIDFSNSPFFVNKQNKSWDVSANEKRMAAISSFGFSGSNAHIVVEEYQDVLNTDVNKSEPHIVPLAAKSVSALHRNIVNLHNFLTIKENLSNGITLKDIAYTLQVGRDQMDCRAAFVVSSLDELIEKLALSIGQNFQNNLADSIYFGNTFSNRQSITRGDISQDAISEWFREANYSPIIDYWISGAHVAWQSFYHERLPKRIELPSYAFENECYWPEFRPQISNINTSQSKVVSSSTQSQVKTMVRPQAVQIKSDCQKNIESDLIQLIHDLFKVPRAKLAADTNLTQFGFDSVSLVKYARALSEYYAISITPVKLFSHATVRAIANYLQEAYPDQIQSFYGIGVDASKSNEKNSPLGEPTTHIPALLNENESNRTTNYSNEPIAIVGIGGKFPQAADLDEFWENLLNGKDCISEIPADRWDWRDYYSEKPDNKNKTNIIWGGFIDGIQKFSPDFFELSEKEAIKMDPQQRLLLKYAYKAIEDAGYSPSSFSGGDAGVFMGISNNGYDNIVIDSGELLDGSFTTGTLSSIAANRISYFFDLHGPSEPIETACASALVAIDRAVNAIQQGGCETAIVGAVNVIVSPNGHMALGKANLLSKEGRCKPFSANADGFVRSEGVGVLVLKRLSSAEKDNDHIYATIRGSGVNHNGRTNFLTAPNPKAQADLLEAVYRNAGIDVNSVTYIEAHGTGTELGDAAEVDALTTAFKRLGHTSIGNKDAKRCAIGSVKSNIGHTEVASGMASIFKILYQMKYKTLVKTIHCDALNPYLQLDNGPFHIVKENKLWNTDNDKNGAPLPRRAGVNALGLGGVNSHIILEEYVDKYIQEKHNSDCLFVFSEKNATQLKLNLQALYEYLEANKDVPLASLAFTLQNGREAKQYRLAIVANSLNDLLEAMRKYLSSARKQTNSGHFYLGEISEQNSDMLSLFQGGEGQVFLDKLAKLRDLNRLAVSWVNGGNIQWNLLYENQSIRRISIPGYQFCESNYWPIKKVKSKLYSRWYESA